MIVTAAVSPVVVPPRPPVSPDRASLLWTMSRFQDADRAWTDILPTILRNNTPRQDAKIQAAMLVGLEQAAAGAKVIAEWTGIPTPKSTFLRNGDRYTQVQYDLAGAMSDARTVAYGDSTEAMRAILAVRGAISGLSSILYNHQSVERAFPVKIATDRLS